VVNMDKLAYAGDFHYSTWLESLLVRFFILGWNIFKLVFKMNS